MTRRIPPSGINLFQLIYILIREYKEKTGLEPLNLSLGNPDGVPTQEILEFQSKNIADSSFELHTYAEDSNLRDFAEGMVAMHSGVEIAEHPHLRAVPIPGIKGASSLIPLACGLHLPDASGRKNFNIVSNLPAYDVIGTWSTQYFAGNRVVWPLATEDNMRLNLYLLKSALDDAKVGRPDVIFVIRPGNPAAVGANETEWRELIEFCIANGTRLVNDGAYAGLVAHGSHVALTTVAKEYPALEWAEMFSVSKSYNDPGARLGVLVGSKDFVEDFVLIKGNTDSGPVPAVMAAYGEFFKDRVNAASTLANLRDLYARRLGYVIPRLHEAGLQPACDSEAGFFTLWKVPKRVLGVELATDPRTRDLPPHEAFNRLVISETGLVGVHFQGPLINGQRDSLIRYAVCADVLNPVFQERFEREIMRLQPEY